jgi:hypothetical protein
MSDKNIDPQELLQAINHLTQFDAEFLDSLTGLSDSDKAYILAIKADREETERRKKLLSSINQSMNDFVSLGKSLTTSSGSFTPIKQTISLVSAASQGVAKKAGSIGKAVATVIDLTAKAANYMIESFEKAYTSFEKISGSGLVSTFDDLQKMSLSVSVSMEQLASSLGDRGTQLASWSGTAVKGAKEFEKLAKSVRSNRESFQLMGITVKELTDSQLDYMDLERKSTRGQIQFDMTYKQGFMDYLDNLSTLATMTGQSRDELRKKMAKQQEEANWRLFSRTRDIKQRENDNALVALMSQMGPTYEEGIKDIIAAQKAGVQATGEAANAVRRSQALGGQNIQANVKKYLEGAMSYAELMDKTLVAGGKAVDGLGLGVISMKDGLDKSIMIENSNAKILSQKSTKQREAEAKAAKNKPPEKIDKSLAAARIEMNDTGVAVEQLSTSSETAAKSMRYLAKKMNEAITEIYQSAGKNVPEMLKVTMAESDTGDKISDAKVKLSNQVEKRKKAQTALSAGGDNMSWVDSRREKVKIQDADTEISRLNKELESLTSDATKLAQKRKELENIRMANSNISAVGAISTTASGDTSGTSSGGLSSGGVYANSGSGAQPPSAAPGAPGTSSTGTAASDSSASGQTGQSDGQSGATSGGSSGAASGGSSSDRITKVLKSGPGGLTAQLADGSVVDRTGTVAWRGNNPGNLRWADWERQFNAVGIQNAGTSGQFTVFATLQDGINAQKNLIFNKYANLSLAQLMGRYDAATAPRYTQIVSQAAGVPPNTLVKNLTDDQQSKLVAAIQRHEGFREGNVKVVSGPTQPTAALPASPEQNPTPVIPQSASPVLVSGPSTGHNVIMQGNQTVVPANSGMEASAIQTMAGPGQQTEATTEFLTMMNNSVDEMIDLMNDKITVQRRLMMHTT